MVSVASLFLMGASLTTSALGSTGTTSAVVSAAASDFVFSVADSAALPTGVNSLEYTTAISPITSCTNGSCDAISSTGAVLPSISPSPDSAGGVMTGGDLALINAPIAPNGVVVSVYITNLAALQQDYSSFAFPINVYSSTCTSTCGSWTADTAVTGASVGSPTYLTSTTGFLTFNLPNSSLTPNTYYDIAMDKGGSYYCTSVSTAGTASITPTFYFTAEPY